MYHKHMWDGFHDAGHQKTKGSLNDKKQMIVMWQSMIATAYYHLLLFRCLALLLC